MPIRASRPIDGRRRPVSRQSDIGSTGLPPKVPCNLQAAHRNGSQEVARPTEFKMVEEVRMPALVSLELEFLCGPIPIAWIIAAARLPGRSLQVGLALWVISEINQSRVVALTNLASQYFGLDRNSKYRGLACLEHEGLVIVRRKLGQPPIVTILTGRDGHE
jgi:hypothetical protein